MASPQVPPQVWQYKRPTTAANQHLFSKTQLCRFHSTGRCTRGENCAFAHGFKDLNSTPNLKCTRLCPSLLKQGSCYYENCNYAHSRQELRASVGDRVPTATRQKKQPNQDDQWNVMDDGFQQNWQNYESWDLEPLEQYLPQGLLNDGPPAPWPAEQRPCLPPFEDRYDSAGQQPWNIQLQNQAQVEEKTSLAACLEQHMDSLNPVRDKKAGRNKHTKPASVQWLEEGSLQLPGNPQSDSKRFLDESSAKSTYGLTQYAASGSESTRSSSTESRSRYVVFSF